MDHRRFETWLLNDEQLTPEKNSELQAHLRICAKCAALAEANLALHSAVMAAPAPGFASRFQARLAAQKKVQRRRYFLGGMILLMAGLGFVVWQTLPFLPSLRTIFSSPTQVLASWMFSLVGLFTSLRAFGEASAIMLRVATGFIPTYAWPLMVVFFVGLSVVWMFSVQKFTRVPARV